ncbi:MAG: PspC domain-containing protein [Allosphingosinicella sp.]
MKRFTLDRRNGKIMGVCAGLARYFGWNANWVRLGVVAVTLLGAFPWTLIAYGLAAWLAKDRPAGAFGDDRPVARTSTYALKQSMTDIDRRIAEVETYVTSPNDRLAREIESLR